MDGRLGAVGPFLHSVSPVGGGDSILDTSNIFAAVLRAATQLVRKRADKVGVAVVLGVAAYFVAAGAVQLLDLGEATAEARPLARAPAAPEPVKAPPRDLSPRPRTAEIICSRNVFDSRRRPCTLGPAPGPARPAPAGNEPSVPPLCGGGLRLRGTVTSTGAEGSFAMIEAGNEARPYRVGDVVEGVGAVERIGWRLVLVDQPGPAACLLDLYETRADRAGRRNPGRSRGAGTWPGPAAATPEKPDWKLMKPIEVE